MCRHSAAASKEAAGAPANDIEVTPGMMTLRWPRRNFEGVARFHRPGRGSPMGPSSGGGVSGNDESAPQISSLRALAFCKNAIIFS